jgi:hypothetical protein
MKRFKISVWLMSILISSAFVSCKKEDPLHVVTSLTMINAVAGSAPLVADFSENGFLPNYYGALQVQYGLYNEAFRLPIDKEDQPLRLLQYPDTTFTSKPLFNLKLQLGKGSINTLFLTGTVDHPEYLISTATPPFHSVADSTFGVRFINLSYQSRPVDVYLITGTGEKVVTGLVYKSVTDYQRFKAIATSGNYTFEFRDQQTQSVLASYVFDEVGKASGNLWRFRNFTLAFIGLPGVTQGAEKQNTLMIPNY